MSNPTLYFVGNSYYGRITTQHSHADNVGRGAPKLLQGYGCGNVDFGDDGVRFYERNTRLGKRHKSRNPINFCTSARTRSRVKSVVLHLIDTNTQVKSKDDDASRTPHEFIPF
ncbi:MAG: hypothetical protein NE330_16700 [Lentisphaeraceae bacterium]|nr:hypothetical protein [Lentisphaeraceae bacterium]